MKSGIWDQENYRMLEYGKRQNIKLGTWIKVILKFELGNLEGPLGSQCYLGSLLWVNGLFQERGMVEFGFPIKPLVNILIIHTFSYRQITRLEKDGTFIWSNPRNVTFWGFFNSELFFFNWTTVRGTAVQSKIQIEWKLEPLLHGRWRSLLFVFNQPSTIVWQRRLKLTSLTRDLML